MIYHDALSDGVNDAKKAADCDGITLGWLWQELVGAGATAAATAAPSSLCKTDERRIARGTPWHCIRFNAVYRDYRHYRRIDRDCRIVQYTYYSRSSYPSAHNMNLLIRFN